MREEGAVVVELALGAIEEDFILVQVPRQSAGQPERVLVAGDLVPGRRGLRHPADHVGRGVAGQAVENLAHVAQRRHRAFAGFDIPGRITARKLEVQRVVLLNRQLKQALDLAVGDLFPQRVLVVLIPGGQRAQLAAFGKGIGEWLADLLRDRIDVGPGAILHGNIEQPVGAGETNQRAHQVLIALGVPVAAGHRPHQHDRLGPLGVLVLIRAVADLENARIELPVHQVKDAQVLRFGSNAAREEIERLVRVIGQVERVGDFGLVMLALQMA